MNFANLTFVCAANVKPFIQCPSDVTVPLPAHQSSAYVRLPQPKANVDWYRLAKAIGHDAPMTPDLDWRDAPTDAVERALNVGRGPFGNIDK